MPTFALPDGTKKDFGSVDEARAYRAKNFPDFKPKDATPAPSYAVKAKGVDESLPPSPIPGVTPRTWQVMKAAGGDVEGASKIAELHKATNPANAEMKDDALVSRGLNEIGIAGRQYRRMQDQGHLKFIPAGPLRGAVNEVEGLIQTNPSAAAYEGVKTPLAATMGRIATGGVRAPESITQGIKSGVTGKGDTDLTALEKMSNEMHEMMQTRASLQGTPYDPDKTQSAINDELRKYFPEDTMKNFESTFKPNLDPAKIQANVKAISADPQYSQSQGAPAPAGTGNNPLAAAAAQERARRAAAAAAQPQVTPNGP